MSTPKGVINISPTVEYYFCVGHLLQNMIAIYKNSLIDKIFFSHVKVYIVDNFELNMKWLESH